MIRSRAGTLCQRIAITGVAGVMLTIASPVGWVQAGEKDELKKELDQIEEEKGDAEQSLQKLKSGIDQRKNTLSELEKEVEETEAKISDTEKKLTKARQTLDRYDSDFKRSVRVMYMKGNSNVESLLSAGSFQEFLARFEIMRLIVKKDYHVVRKYYLAKQEIEDERDRLVKLGEKKNKETERARKAYDTLVKDVNKNQTRLAGLEEEEGNMKEELQKLNLSYLKAGNFSYQGPLRKPLDGGTVTSPYGPRSGEFHTGIDYAAPIGTPIKAAANGKVIRSQSCSCGFGYYIVIDHGGGVFSLYGHMWGTTSRVRVGEVVKKDQQIADVGNNGRSSGPHVHFEVHRGSPGNYVNPASFLN